MTNDDKGEDAVSRTSGGHHFGTVLAYLIGRPAEVAFRDGWNGKRQCVALQTPDGFSLMTEPYLFMTIYGESFSAHERRLPWTPTQKDMLTADWQLMSRGDFEAML